MLRHGSDVQQEEAFALYAEALRTFSKTLGAEAIELGPVYMGMAPAIARTRRGQRRSEAL